MNSIRFITNSFRLPKIKKIHIIEVGPRDGLQNEKKSLSINQRKTLINKCTSIGLTHIEVGSFINPKLVPQVANTFELLNELDKDYFYSVLVPHVKFWNNHSKIREIVLFVAASESFNKKNINCTTDEAFKRFEPILNNIKDRGIMVRGSISTCLKCPYEGNTSIDSVMRIIEKYIECGVDMIDIADTIGEGTPEQTDLLLRKIKEYYPIQRFTGHFHDTNDLAIQNVEACLKNGMTIFHSSIGGLGGCPFSPKRAGNLSTEKLIDYLHKNGYYTGVNKEECEKVGKWIQEELR